MTKGEELKRDLDAKKEIAQKDREQREKDSKRRFIADIIGSATGGLARVGASAVKGGAKSVSKYIMNDAAWYKQWIEDYSRYLNYPTFNNVRHYVPCMGGKDYDQNGDVYGEIATPGVMEIEYQPMLGLVHSQTSASGPITERVPINVALARSISQIRKSNGRTVNYNPDVLGFYWISAIELATFLADLKTVLEVVMNYQPNNTYVPRTIVEAKGWVFTFVRDNRADLIKVYQQYASRFNSNIAIPADLSLLKRRVWLPSVILKDANLKRSQYYVFHQKAYGTFKSDETAIEYEDDQTIKASLSSIVTYLETAFVRLEESVTMISLVADIRSGIPATKFAKLPEAIQDVAPVYEASHEVLAQIHNAKAMPLPNYVSPSLSNVFSDGTYIYNLSGVSGMQETFTNANEASNIIKIINEVSYGGVVIDTYDDALTADDLLVDTRFTSTYVATPDSTDAKIVRWAIDCCGTEVCTRFNVHYFDSYRSVQLIARYGQLFTYVDPTRLFLWSTFDWSPVLYHYTVSTSNQARNLAAYGELGNAFFMDDKSLREIHRMCISSEGYLPDSVFTATFGKSY